MTVVNQLLCILYLRSCLGSMYKYVDYLFRRNVEFSERSSSHQNRASLRILYGLFKQLWGGSQSRQDRSLVFERSPSILHYSWKP